MMLKFLPGSLKESPAYQALEAELHPDRLVPSLIAGGITGMIGVIRAISYAALIFSGSLASQLNVGVGMAVCSSALISVVVALTSTLPGMIATPLAAPTVVLTVLAAGIAQQLGPAADAQSLVLTVVAAIALGSLLTGLVLWVLGQLRWGRAMEFLPYPVVGGFMAGTGLLLVRGAFKVMTGKDLTLGQIAWFCQGAQCPRWLAGLAIAAVLLWATKRLHHYLVMPGVLALATLIFYGTVWGSHQPIAVVREQGWLLGPFPQGSLWHPLTTGSLAQVQWGAIAQASPILGLLVFVSLLSLVLTNSSIELAVEKDLDLNQELKAIGLANLVAGLGSTMAGNQALPSTLLVHRLGAANRLAGVFKALPCLLVLVLGPTFLSYFPKPILGSLLLFLGLDLLGQWLYGAWFRLPWVDYAIIWATLVVINTSGFISGIGLGFALATAQFLMQCGRLDAVDAGESPDNPALEADGEAEKEAGRAGAISRIDTARLQSILFFGNAKGLCQGLCDRILHRDPDHPPLQYLILDCRQVIAMDSSAAMSLGKVAKLAQKHNCTLVFCHLTEPDQWLLYKTQTLALAGKNVLSNYSEAVSWCEAQWQTASTPEALDTAGEQTVIEPPLAEGTDHWGDAPLARHGQHEARVDITLG
ncbi:SulP family inorganic anion transporter [Nodosilinea sp. LEGE 07088]|uniref:SulP family inorganic anion transporter n=1 Tax=Nodosilinea sp. LEGE 07088 TaxID=2777968 RepID=UPI001880CAB7|nr:SulP family inorganic anion transporter [Nodosilinea sp. LEGE 07088]MBE9140525.1 SulP family inorganic anion transporter [Nodosilinea sp. LEGE 07088]